ncbi:hypothetical protein C7974DRAFT_163792 [Boeremia exigua]|uniref:uncharacterized protein n=1 Tax=Boeremia exigua TaxID=749465 RepID=UPI001E8E4B4E|nr:uncharacterized protein C7974DRAFT_163792 [Boeremia exigua]KAH6633046.1 hypothetical protein C7974DRAFT_163792 [Boeremia exigua]
MRLHQYLSIGSLVTLVAAQGKCRFGNGTLLPDVPEWNIYQPCAASDGPTTICCATNRDNEPWGNVSLGFTRDECLPNGVCQNRLTTNEGQPVTTWFIDYCTENGQSDSAGKCLNVCPTASLELTAKITPCDGTATSSRWCCGDTRGCCNSNSGVVLLEQVLGQVSSSVISSSSPATSSSSSVTTPTPSTTSASAAPLDTGSTSTKSNGLSGGAIGGIVVGVVVGLALIAAALFFARKASRRKKAPYAAPDAAEVPYSPAEVPYSPAMPELGSTVKYAHVQEMPGAPPSELHGDVPMHAHKP